MPHKALATLLLLATSPAVATPPAGGAAGGGSAARRPARTPESRPARRSAPAPDGPGLRRLVDAALARQARRLPDPTARWRRNLRLAALLPRLSLRLVLADRTGVFFDVRPAAEMIDTSSSRALRWEIRASWNLDRLLFDGRELRIRRLARERVRARRQLTRRVVDLYFQRRRLRAALADPRLVRAGRADVLTSIARATAMLEILTDGLISGRASEKTGR